MFKRFVKLAPLVILSLFSSLASAQNWVAGEHYEVISSPVPTADSSKIEVVEAFGYLCPHCNSFEPLLHAWIQELPEDVSFENMPVVFGRSWEPMARAYYVAELMGVKDKVHQAIYDAVHLQRQRFSDAEDLAELFADYGVDQAEFIKQYNSFAVGMKLKQSDSRMRGYQISGVPSMIVNGKYVVSASTAGSHENVLKVVEHLIDQERN